MIAVLAYGVTLLVASLISELAHRSVLSTTVLFLIVGFLIGDEVLSLIEVQPASPVVARLAEVALFTTLFTDGMRAVPPSASGVGTQLASRMPTELDRTHIDDSKGDLGAAQGRMA